MIVLDTNVVSEPLKPGSAVQVTDWLDAQQVSSLYLPCTGLAELLAGIEKMPDGRRREQLRSGLMALLDRLIGSRMLAFDREAAVTHARLVASAAAKGFTVSFGDAQIAATAAVHGFSVATRDVSPFLAMGVPVIDPWDPAAR